MTEQRLSENDIDIEIICSEIEGEIVDFVKSACDIVKSCKEIDEKLKSKYRIFKKYQENLKLRDAKLKIMIDNNKKSFFNKKISYNKIDTIYNKKNSYITLNEIINIMIDYNYNNNPFDDGYKNKVTAKFNEIKELNLTLYAFIEPYAEFILNPISECNNNPIGGKSRSKRSRKNKNKKSKNTRRKSIRRRR